MLTAAVRDLKASYPDLSISVSTPYPFLWEGNPYISTPSLEGTTTIDLGYKTPHQDSTQTGHFIYAFHRSIERLLGLTIKRGSPFPDIWLTANDYNITGVPGDKPILLINAGSKPDFPIKQWPQPYFQQVADACAAKYTVIQIGETGRGIHRPLKGVLNMLNKTPKRELVRLMAISDVVVTGVSYPMHLCAALNGFDGKNRKCVVLAGGREAEEWEKYPNFIYLSGACEHFSEKTGCWLRYLPEQWIKSDEYCKKPVRLRNSHYYASCMANISPEMVIAALL